MNKKIMFERKSIYFIVFTITIIGYLIYIMFIHSLNFNENYTIEILILSWLGILVALFVFWTWKQLTGKYFTLYTIFMLFFFLFNYGQPLMWAIGIHNPNDIINGNLYTLGKANSSSILFAQSLTLISILMFHLGAILCFKPKLFKIDNYQEYEDNYSNITREAIYKVSIIISMVVIPITFYNIITDLIYAQSYGYKALHYDENRYIYPVFGLIQYLFFPTLVGLLIGSGYKKKVMLIVYIIFGLYLVINLFYGDRGLWIYSLMFLIFMSHTYYKKIPIKKFIFYGIIGTISLYIVNTIVSIRDIGVNINNILEALSLENFPLITTVFEMGESMKPTIVLIQYGWDVWPYANSYLNSLIGILSTEIFTLLNLPFDTISNWFSNEYLVISYGAGFSIVAEPLLNYGPFFSPLFMIILGYIISSLTFLDKSINFKKYPLRVFFAVSSMHAFTPLVRNHSHFVMKSWVFGVLIVFGLIIIMREILIKKNQENQELGNKYKITWE